MLQPSSQKAFGPAKGKTTTCRFPPSSSSPLSSYSSMTFVCMVVLLYLTARACRKTPEETQTTECCARARRFHVERSCLTALDVRYKSTIRLTAACLVGHCSTYSFAGGPCGNAAGDHRQPRQSLWRPRPCPLCVRVPQQPTAPPSSSPFFPCPFQGDMTSAVPQSRADSFWGLVWTY